MAKKKKKKKRKGKISKPVPKPTPPGELKISEAVLKISQPLLSRFREPHRIQTIIYLAIMAWNISIFENKERSELQEKLVETLPSDFGGEDVGTLLENLDTFIERKEKMFPDVREYIMDHHVSFSGDTYSLTVSAVPVGERNEHASS